RRGEDDDPLYSVMAADPAGDGEEDGEDLRGQHEEESSEAWASAEGEAAVAADANGFDADEPVSRDGSQQLALGRLRADEEQPQADADADADDALFDGPGAPALATAPEAPSADDYASDSSQAVGVLESRMKELERRLDQLTD